MRRIRLDDYNKGLTWPAWQKY